MEYFSSNQPRIDRMKAMFELKDISPKTQSHLSKVYGNVMFCAVVCALGMYLNAYTIL